MANAVGTRRGSLGVGRKGGGAGGDTLSDPLAKRGGEALVVQPLGEVSEALPASSGGGPLPEGVRGDMEGSYGTDFSNVKVHTDGAGGASAFARGEHLHFASGQFDPHSVGGREKIGHELGHVQQQRAGRVPLPQFKDFPVNVDPALEGEADREGAKAARGLPAHIAGSSEGLAIATGAAQGWDFWDKLMGRSKQKEAVAGEAPPDAGKQADVAPAAAGPSALAAQQPGGQAAGGGREQVSSTGFAVDAGLKSTVVGTGAGFMAAKPVGEFTGAVSEQSNLLGGQGGAIGASVLGGGGLLAAGYGLHSGRKRANEAGQKDAQGNVKDAAGARLGQETMEEAGMGITQASLGTATAGVDIANISKNGAGAVLSNAKTASDFAGAAGNALSIAGATLGLAGNALAFAQAAYQGAGAINRWSKLSGAAEKIESERGKVWYDRIKNRTKWKTALQGLKMAAAGLGIVAGAFALLSNPVGWAIGIAAGATMATVALGKLFGGISKKRDQKNKTNELKAKKESSAMGSAPAPGGADPAVQEQVREQQAEVQEEAAAAPPTPAEQQANQGAGQGQASQQNPGERKRVRSMADEAAAMCSTNAKVAGEMIDAIHNYRGTSGEAILAEIQAKKGGAVPVLDEFCDAIVLLRILGITEDQASSASGQELIESKISSVAGL